MNFKREVDRLMSDFSFPSSFRDDYSQGFAPLCEVQETNEDYKIRFEIPGMNKEEIRIELSNNILSVSGEKRPEQDQVSEMRHFSEISYGSFFRRMSLPNSVDSQRVDAEYKDGILTVIAKKQPNGNAKQIKIL
ncbi:MAG: Hsp20/alpha crystallin family protein [Oligoflexales bacterium]